MPELKSYRPFPGLMYRRQSDDVDVIIWSNRQAPKNRLLLAAFMAGLLLAAPVALFLTSRLLSDIYNLQYGLPVGSSEILISSLFVIGSWLAVGGSLYYLLRLTWTETIKISDEGISLLYSGPLAPKDKHIPARDVWRLSFEKYGHERDRESRYTLNIFSDNKRETLAYWIRAEENYQLFLLLARIFNARGWSIQCKSDYRQNG